MIICSLENLDRYAALSEAFAKAVAWIGSGVWQYMTDGRYEIDGTRVYGLLMTVDTTGESEKRYEAHRRYADIQICLEGDEVIMARGITDLRTVVEYSDEKDILFFHDPESGPAYRIPLARGTAAVFFPEDAHKPCVAPGTPGPVRKLVVKIAVD